MRVHAKLTIRITYDDVENLSQVRAVLYQAANHLASNGLLSDDHHEMIVDTWDSDVIAAREET